jgi:hypothetical protein
MNNYLEMQDHLNKTYGIRVWLNNRNEYSVTYFNHKLNKFSLAKTNECRLEDMIWALNQNDPDWSVEDIINCYCDHVI